MLLLHRTLLAILLSGPLGAIAPLSAGDPPYGLETRVAVAPYLGNKMPVSPPVPLGYSLVVAFPQLHFQGPIAVRPVPGTNRLWVIEREGRIWSFENDPLAASKTLVLDLNDDDLDLDDIDPDEGHVTTVSGVETRWWCQGWDDSGLMGLAFHPQFGVAGSPNRGHFYLGYQAKSVKWVNNVNDAPVYRPDSATAANNTRNRVARFSVPDASLAADPASEVVLIDQPDRHLWHNGGDLFFDNDGYLYVCNGDEGSAGDPFFNTQRIHRSLFAGVFRIDVDWTPSSTRSHATPRQPVTGSTANYGIPNDNPFVGVPGVLEEFYAHGLRSPHRMTYDPPTGRIVFGDIGQGSREELSLVVPGGNYQWGYREGNRPYTANRIAPNYLAAATAVDATTVNVSYTAPVGDPQLGAGMFAVGDLIRFEGHDTIYAVQSSSGYPVNSLTISPKLSVAIAAGTTVYKTTGFRITAETAFENGSNAPNEVGSSTLSLTGGAMTLTVGASVAIPGVSGSYSITSVTGSPATAITIRPRVSASPNAKWLDRATVIGSEQPPLIDFARSGSQAFSAIIGGYVYRGSALPDLVGRYVFADNPRGSLWTIDLAVGASSLQPLCNMPTYTQFDANGYRGLSGFGFDQAGELLVCRMQVNGAATNASQGQIWKLIRNPSSTPDPAIPALLKDTGAFVVDANGTLTQPLTPAAGVIPYAVNAELWSDGASKQRWMALPNPGGGSNPFTDQIVNNTTNAWGFPVGTVFVKHFELTVNEQAVPPIKRRLETRLLVRSPAGSGVYGVTYKWRADGTHADLLNDAVSESYTITQANGSTRTQIWYYPSRADCLTCHNGNAGLVLGVNTRQLNGPCTYPTTGVTDNQLRTWNHLGLFTNTLAEPTIATLPRMAGIADSSADVEHRSRSWIDANCSHCHRPGGVHTNFDARYDTPLDQQQLIDAAPLLTYDSIINPRIIARGSVSRSVLHRRDNSVDPDFQMPPLAKSIVHGEAMTVLSAWITSLGTPQTVAITSPADGAALPLPTTTTITADVGASSWVTRVDFHVDNVLLGSDTSAPYSIAWTPTATGTYQLTATVTDHAGMSTTSTAVTVTTVKSPATVTFTSGTLAQVYDNTPKTVTATTVPAGLPLVFGYPGGTPPVNAGSYAVSATIDHPHYQGTAADTLVVGKAPVSVTLGGLVQTVDGAPKPVTVTTDPTGFTVTVTYDGAATVPSGVGSYAVVASVDDANHGGSASGTLTLKAQPVLSIAPVAFAEGDAGSADASLTATLSDTSSATITVAWSAGPGTATAGGDFTAASGVLTFAPGETSRPLIIPVLGDTQFEGDETVVIALSDPQQVILAADSAVLTISEDDPDPSPGGGGNGSSSGGGGGCGLGGGISGLLAFALILLRRNRLR